MHINNPIVNLPPSIVLETQIKNNSQVAEDRKKTYNAPELILNGLLFSIFLNHQIRNYFIDERLHGKSY